MFSDFSIVPSSFLAISRKISLSVSSINNGRAKPFI